MEMRASNWRHLCQLFFFPLRQHTRFSFSHNENGVRCFTRTRCLQFQNKLFEFAFRTPVSILPSSNSNVPPESLTMEKNSFKQKLLHLNCYKWTLIFIFLVGFGIIFGYMLFPKILKTIMKMVCGELLQALELNFLNFK